MATSDPVSERNSRTGQPWTRVVVAMYYQANRVRGRRNLFARILNVPLSALYRTVALFVVGIDIPVSTKIGRGLVIHHGNGLVVHDQCEIGNEVTLRHNTTLGAKAGGRGPRIGDRVDVGANSVVLGSIDIGNDAVIGAGSVVTKSVPAGAVVAGNPAQVISFVKSRGHRA